MFDHSVVFGSYVIACSIGAHDIRAHCLDLNLNDETMGTSFDNGFILEKINENRKKISCERKWRAALTGMAHTFNQPISYFHFHLFF